MASDEGDLRIVFSWAMQDGDSGWAVPGLFSFNDFGIGLERVQSGLRTK
jgi:hypothetical protein